MEINQPQSICCFNCGSPFQLLHGGYPGQIVSVPCPHCGSVQWRSLQSPPLHLVISNHNGKTLIKPSRPATRNELLGLLHDASEMIGAAGKDAVLHPDNCELKVFLTVDYAETPQDQP